MDGRPSTMTRSCNDDACHIENKCYPCAQPAAPSTLPGEDGPDGLIGIAGVDGINYTNIVTIVTGDLSLIPLTSPVGSIIIDTGSNTMYWYRGSGEWIATNGTILILPYMA